MATYKVLRNYVVHKARLVGPGELLELGEAKAERLVEMGQIDLVADAAQAPAAAAEAVEEEAPEVDATLPEATPEPIKPPAKKRK